MTLTRSRHTLALAVVSTCPKPLNSSGFAKLRKKLRSTIYGPTKVYSFDRVLPGDPKPLVTSQSRQKISIQIVLCQMLQKKKIEEMMEFGFQKCYLFEKHNFIFLFPISLILEPVILEKSMLTFLEKL